MEGYKKLNHEDIQVHLIDVTNEDVIKTENQSLSLDKNDLLKRVNILEQEILKAEMDVIDKSEELKNLKVVPYENADYMNLVKKVEELKDQKTKLINSN